MHERISKSMRFQPIHGADRGSRQTAALVWCEAQANRGSRVWLEAREQRVSVSSDQPIMVSRWLVRVIWFSRSCDPHLRYQAPWPESLPVCWGTPEASVQSCLAPNSAISDLHIIGPQHWDPQIFMKATSRFWCSAIPWKPVDICLLKAELDIHWRKQQNRCALSLFHWPCFDIDLRCRRTMLRESSTVGCLAPVDGNIPTCFWAAAAVHSPEHSLAQWAASVTFGKKRVSYTHYVQYFRQRIPSSVTVFFFFLPLLGGLHGIYLRPKSMCAMRSFIFLTRVSPTIIYICIDCFYVMIIFYRILRENVKLSHWGLYFKTNDSSKLSLEMAMGTRSLIPRGEFLH